MSDKKQGGAAAWIFGAGMIGLFILCTVLTVVLDETIRWFIHLIAP